MSDITQATSESNAALSIREFIRIEKNLTTLGFFTPTQGRGKLMNRPKVLRIRRELPGGKIIEAEATIIPSVEHGLPTTPDQDKYLAFQQIVQERRKENGGIVQNPIPFSSYELCTRVGLNTGGKNYADISEWLDRMVATTIRSKGTVYLAKRKTYVKDTFHVFDRVIAAGKQLSDGSIADRNYVWLSEWQIENLNARYQLPVDFESYKQLRTHIGKALVPLLQVWLFPSRAFGKFEKRYADVCELLSLRPQTAPSLIDRQLRPALDELLMMGYISNWSIERTTDSMEHKLVLFHGPKYLSDLKLVNSRSEDEADPKMPLAETGDVLELLTERGITPTAARKLIKSMPLGQPVQEQLAWCDSIIRQGKLSNPAGFVYSVLKNNEPVPEAFLEAYNSQSQIRSESGDAYCQRIAQEQQYEHYIESSVENALSFTFAPAQYEDALKRFIPEIRTAYPNLPDDTVREISVAKLKREIRDSLQLMTLEEFCSREQFSLF